MPLSLQSCSVTNATAEELFARVYPAPLRASRTPFQRDRERIVQARAFRRLAGGERQGALHLTDALLVELANLQAGARKAGPQVRFGQGRRLARRGRL